MSDSPLVRNSAHCLICDDEIVSTHRHDFVRCSCGRIAVDGGLAYARRVFAKNARWEDTSIYEDDQTPEELARWRRQQVADIAFSRLIRLVGLTDAEIAEREAGPFIVKGPIREANIPAYCRGMTIVELALKKTGGAEVAEVGEAIEVVLDMLDHMRKGGL